MTSIASTPHQVLKHALTQSHLRKFVEVRLPSGWVSAAATPELSQPSSPVGDMPSPPAPTPAVWQQLQRILSVDSPHPQLRAAFEERRRRRRSRDAAVDEAEPLDQAINWRALVGGNSNRVFVLAERPLSAAPDKCRIPLMILREYGAAMETFLSREKELQAALLLANRGVAPAVFGAFPEGRVEQFVEGTRPGTTEELLSNAALRDAVLRALRRLHGVDTAGADGFDPERPCLGPMLRRLVGLVAHFCRDGFELASTFTADLTPPSSPLSLSLAPAANDASQQRLTLVDVLNAEVAWLMGHFTSGSGGPVVFAHNDANPGNLLWAPRGDDSGSVDVTFIDFEYADVNYRGFDLGNYMCELDYVYDDGVTGGFTKRFATAHAEAARKAGLAAPGSPVLAVALYEYVCGADEASGSLCAAAPELRELGSVLAGVLRSYHDTELITAAHVREALLGMLASHLLWGAWAIVMACTPPRLSSPLGSSPPVPDAFQVGSSGLDYVHYAHTRLLEYATLKEWFITHHRCATCA